MKNFKANQRIRVVLTLIDGKRAKSAVCTSKHEMQAIDNSQPSPPTQPYSPNSPPYPLFLRQVLILRSKQVRFHVPMTPPPEKDNTDVPKSLTLQEVKPDVPPTNEVFK